MNNEVKINNVLEILNNNRKSKGGLRLRNNVKYEKLIPEDLGGIQLSPQAIKLVEIILNSSEESWKEPELQELINSHKEISEKQEPWKIFQYYRKSLIESGFIKMIKE